MTRLPGERTPGASTPPPGDGRSQAELRRSTTQIRSIGNASTAPPPANPEVVLEEPSPEGSGPASGRRMVYATGAIVDDKYQLLRPLGAGGMGEVWVAHHLGLDIDVAV